MSKVLVTGSTGFIGVNLVNFLIKQNYDVYCVARDKNKTRRLPPEANIIYASLDELDKLSDYITDVDYVYHLAGLTKARNRQEMIKYNFEKTKELVELTALSKPSSFKRFVYISSQAASAPSQTAICEEHESKPLSCYGESKILSEDYLKNYDNLPITIIRPPSVYGPWDKDIFFYFQLADKGFVPIIGDPKRAFSIVHVEDLIRGIVFSAEHDRTISSTYFISDQNPITWGKFASIMQSTVLNAKGSKPLKMKLPFFIMYLAAFFNEISAFILRKPALLSFEKIREMKQSWVCDSSRIYNLGYKTEIELEKGIEQTYKWYKENKWL